MTETIPASLATPRVFVLRSWKTRSAAAAALALGIGATQVPLLRSPGYEFALLVALLSTIVAGPLTIALVRPVYRWSEAAQRRPETLRAFLRALGVSMLLFLLPLLAPLVSVLFTGGCDLRTGLAWYLLLPGVTALLAPSIALFCIVHYRHPRLLYTGGVLVTVAYALALGYWTPAVFSYNLFYGYFPGLTYDELLPLTSTLVGFRLGTVILSLAFLWWSDLLLRFTVPADPLWRKGAVLIRCLLRPRRLPVTILLAASAGVVVTFRGPLGLETTTAYLETRLSDTVTTEHATIHVAPGAYSEPEKRRLAALLEFRLQQILHTLALAQVDHLDAYIYPTATMKQQLMGAGATEIAKPWSRQVHLTASSVEWALAHELVHVVAGRFGVPVLRANTSPGLVEGVAMALAPDAGERTYHQYAAAMRSQGIRPDLVSLMRPTGFVVQSSSVSYILAGSFCRYLLDRYGVRQLMTVYRTSDYEAAYGRTVEQLVDEWEGFLERLAPRPGDAELVDALFRRPPIFRKTCPRLAARAVAEGRAEFQRGDFPGAAERFADVYRTTGAYEAFSGWLFSLARQGRQDSVRALYTRIVEADTRPARYLSLGVLFGDAFWAGGDTAAAALLYRTVRRAALSDQLTEQAALRLRVLPDDSSGAWRMFFLSPPADSLRSVLLDSLRLDSVTPCAARYVRGQLAARRGRPGEAAEEFLAAAPCAADSVLAALALRNAGRSLLDAGDAEGAKRALWESLNFAGDAADLARVNDWIDRCSWMATALAPKR